MVVSSADFGFRKPNHAIFTYVLDKLGVEPHEAIMVGDMPEFDIVPAKELGLKTVWKRNGKPLDSPLAADWTIDELSDVLSIYDVLSNFHNPRALTVGIWFRASVTSGKVVAGDDLKDAKFFPIDALPEPSAFPTDRIILDRLRVELTKLD